MVGPTGNSIGFEPTTLLFSNAETTELLELCSYELSCQSLFDSSCVMQLESKTHISLLLATVFSRSVVRASEWITEGRGFKSQDRKSVV